MHVIVFGSSKVALFASVLQSNVLCCCTSCTLSLRSGMCCLGLQAHGSHTSKAYVQSKLKFDAVCGLDSNPSLLLESIAGLITVTSSPAGLLYYYIKEAQMVLSDWCYPSVDSSWYVGVDTH